MEIYKVGGCVRDKLLGIKSNDNDFVVVGSSVDQMISLGFRPVGKDFPVFLHPKTNEEYALARSEKKISVGYRGFVFNTSPDISLIDDLARRDITINAIAEDESGNLIDPFDGQKDLNNGLIRHISDAFAEDPLRVLRVARFSAKLNFTVANETIQLMKQIVISGELKSLSQERIWLEINKAMLTKYSSNFFIILNDCGALQQILPECIPFINDSNSFNLFINMSQDMENLHYPIQKRHSILYYFISNYFTIDETRTYIDKSGMNKQSKALALLLSKHYNTIKELHKLSYNDIYSILANIDPIRRQERAIELISLIAFIAKNKDETQILYNLEILKKIIGDFNSINYKSMLQLHPDSLINAIHEEKIRIIKNVLFAASTK